MSQDSPQKLLTVEDFLNIIPISRPTLSRMTRAGKVPHVRVGRRIFFRPEQVEAFLVSCHE